MKKGQRVWSKEFPPGLRQDLLTIENSIYSELVSALDLKPNDEDLTRGAMRMTGNYSAYELYLKGTDIVHRQRDAKGFTAAMKFYDQAIRKDPRFTLAYAGIAEASMLLYEETKVALVPKGPERRSAGSAAQPRFARGPLGAGQCVSTDRQDRGVYRGSETGTGTGAELG